MAQNVPLWRVRQLQQTPWLYEGLPVWIGNQQAYFSHAEFVQFTKSNELLPLFERPDNMRLAYVAWRIFKEWLYRRHGRPKYLAFLHAWLATPASLDSHFEAAFVAEVRTGGFSPSPSLPVGSPHPE